MTPQYRGSLLSKWNYKYTRLLRYYGIDSEMWRVGIIISVLFLFIFGLVAWASRFVRDIDPAELGPTVGASTKKTD
jgi:hypothetical protein